tara:strand:- start:454 stop:660 length:207 start_codon:yes stop_codon:yes gene_type:complete
MNYNKAELVKAFKVLQQFTEDIDFFAQITITSNESILAEGTTFLNPDKQGFEDALFRYAESQNIKLND